MINNGMQLKQTEEQSRPAKNLIPGQISGNF
jgi:hypothetical protein